MTIRIDFALRRTAADLGDLPARIRELERRPPHLGTVNVGGLVAGSDAMQRALPGTDEIGATVTVVGMGGREADQPGGATWSRVRTAAGTLRWEETGCVKAAPSPEGAPLWRLGNRSDEVRVRTALDVYTCVTREEGVGAGVNPLEVGSEATWSVDVVHQDVDFDAAIAHHYDATTRVWIRRSNGTWVVRSPAPNATAEQKRTNFTFNPAGWVVPITSS